MLQLEPLTILLVEDDRADQKLIQKSLTEQKIANDLEIVNSGEEGLEYLNACKQRGNGKLLPNLILLDLNMPGMGGKAFLKHIKEDENKKMGGVLSAPPNPPRSRPSPLGGKSVLLATKKAPKRRRAVLC